jgi:signal transduction histidine kinase
VLITGQRERAHINGYQDRQELQQYAEELETVNGYLGEEKRERDSFLSMASHELKTPVTALRAYSELLLRRLAKRSASIDTSDLEAAFHRMNEQTIKLTTLIDELLDVDTFRSHQIVLSRSRYDLNQLCRKVIEDQHVLTGREMVFSPSVEPLELQMDVDRMTQVILNLVNNALKYSSQDKPVEVRVSQNDQRVLLGVQDHGFGIAPDELPHIFEMYYRTPRARSSTTSGLGLGLAISKDITDRHGGRIWCTSELGVGSTFFVELPCQNE